MKHTAVSTDLKVKLLKQKTDQKSDMEMPNILEMLYHKLHLSVLLVLQSKKKTDQPEMFLVMKSIFMTLNKL